MFEKLAVHLKGLNPTIQHNGRLASPVDPWAKLMKPLTSKRKKSENDWEKIWEYEFKGGLYLLDDSLTEAVDGKTVVWPADNLHALLKKAAQRRRNGPKIDTGVMFTEDWPLIYKGPATRNGLWREERFRFIRGVGVNRKTVQRCRVIFEKWEMKFDMEYDSEIWDLEDLVQTVKDAGRFVGLSDYRPKYGLFQVVDVTNGEAK